jgi:hypothetical protein
MTTTEIRAEIVEMINSGVLNIPKIVKYFRQHRPEANLKIVREESKELIAQVKETIKRGY